MSEYSENTGGEKFNGKKSDSNKPSNREMDYFGEKPGKLDNLISETDNKENREQKNDYFGEKPEKLEKILADDTKNRTAEQKLDYFGEKPEKLDKFLSTSPKEKLKNSKLDDSTNKPNNLITLRKSGKIFEKNNLPEIQPYVEKPDNEKLYPNPPRKIDMYTADGRKVQLKIYPDGRVERVILLTKDLTGNEKMGQKDASAKLKSISKPANNKLFRKDAPTFKLKKNPIPESEPYRINKKNPKN